MAPAAEYIMPFLETALIIFTAPNLRFARMAYIVRLLMLQVKSGAQNLAVVCFTTLSWGLSFALGSHIGQNGPI